MCIGGVPDLAQPSSAGPSIAPLEDWFEVVVTDQIASDRLDCREKPNVEFGEIRDEAQQRLVSMAGSRELRCSADRRSGTSTSKPGVAARRATYWSVDFSQFHAGLRPHPDMCCNHTRPAQIVAAQAIGPACLCDLQ